MNNAADLTLGAAALGALAYATRRARPGRIPRDGVSAGLAIGILSAAREALVRGDTNTAWHLLGDERIDWQSIAAAVEQYPHEQAPALAALIRTGPRAFLGRLQAVATAAAMNTIALLLAAMSDTSAVLAKPERRPDGGR